MEPPRAVTVRQPRHRRDLSGRQALPLRQQQHLAVPQAQSAQRNPHELLLTRRRRRLPGGGRPVDQEPILQREAAAVRAPLVSRSPSRRRVQPYASRITFGQPLEAAPRRRGTPRRRHPARRSQRPRASPQYATMSSCRARTARQTAAARSRVPSYRELSQRHERLTHLGQARELLRSTPFGGQRQPTKGDSTSHRGSDTSDIF